MPTVTCNACNSGFDDEEQHHLHYRSEWHRNLKRKVMTEFESESLGTLIKLRGELVMRYASIFIDAGRDFRKGCGFGEFVRA